jgi:hypothetical protein
MMEQFIKTSIKTAQLSPMRRMMGVTTNSDRIIATARADLLDSASKDIGTRVEKGENQEQIKAYFWGCPEFQHLWAKTLGMEEATLDELIRGTLAGEG